jgi:hypothetical protein
MTTTLDVLGWPMIQALCLGADDAGALLTPGAWDPAAEAERARRAGQVLAAWDGGRYLYPRFQWDLEGRSVPQLAALLDVLPRERDGSLGAEAVVWMFAPDDALDGNSPGEIFGAEPERVISLARRRRFGDDDAD